MTRIVLDADERYPFFYIDERATSDLRNTGRAPWSSEEWADVSDAELAELREAREAFLKWQNRLRELYNTHCKDDRQFDQEHVDTEDGLGL